MARPVKPTKASGPDAPDQVSTTIRMPADLRRQLEEAAADQTRNLSQEIERRLRRSLDPMLAAGDALDALKANRGIYSEEFQEFVGRALHMIVGERAGKAGMFLAIALGVVGALERGAPGALVHINKDVLDKIKEAVAEIEAKAVVTTIKSRSTSKKEE